MPRAAFVVAGRFDARTGGSLYDRRMIEALRDRGWSIDVRESHGVPSADLFAAFPDRSTVIVDGMAFGAAPDAVLSERGRLRFVPVVHLPLGAEIGLEPGVARELAAGEQRAMGAAGHVVVTGRGTVETIRRYGVPVDRISVINPGTDPAPIAAGSSEGPLQLLCVAVVSPGKGHELLARALAANRDSRWMLACAGSLTRYPATSERLRAELRSSGLEDRVTLTGELDDSALDAWYRRTDVFVLPTRHETFGMAVAEAVARGIPVVSTSTGEIPALISPDAGLLARPGDAGAFGSALSRVLTDAALRTRLREGAIRARDRLQRWEHAAGRMVAVLERVANG